MLEGLMQDDFPLTLTHIRRRMSDCNGDSRVVSAAATEHARRMTFAELGERVDRLARALQTLGVGPGDRVATFAWNSHRHLELYFAVPCIGAVLHTVNVRLFAEQVRYIINHAEDRIIFVDAELVDVLEPLAGQLKRARHFVIMGESPTGSLPRALAYEELLSQAAHGAFDYPTLDERQAAALCYTSGTTGNPKGVLYSHRSISLHSSALLMADVLGLAAADRVLAVVPMFHVNAWGLPYGAALAGADIVLPDRFLSPERLAGLIERERPTLMACVPTVFADLLRYADEHGSDLSSLSRGLCGGSAVPRHLMQGFEQRYGVQILQAWGMTETSPICTVSRPPDSVDAETRWRLRAKQGRAVPWVELRLSDEDGAEASCDGESPGEVQVRGPWVAARYYADPTGDDRFRDGWLRTGDIATLDELGFLQITDRTKDVIKSGGEWISSVELENELMAHPDVLEAAVIGKPDERWGERPLACVVLRTGAAPNPDTLRQHLQDRVAKWWLPDEFAFIDQVPKTSVGKFDKKRLRAQLNRGDLR
jgi:fatty-acyl-CoA synthase